MLDKERSITLGPKYVRGRYTTDASVVGAPAASTV
jgi:hypothetical protein